MIRLALVGYGRWGRNYVKAARESGAAQVTSVVTRSSDNAASVPTGVSVYENTTEAVHNCDAMIYAGHPAGAVLAANIALHAGKPVMIEKPAGLSLADAQRIADAEAKHGGLVLVAHQHLFAEGYERFRSMSKRAQYFHAKWCGHGPVRDYSSLWDYGPHAVSAALGAFEATGKTEVFRADGSVFLRRGIQTCRVTVSNTATEKSAWIGAEVDGVTVFYDAYKSTAEPPLTRAVRAFANAVKSGGTDDWRFGARWAVDVARILEAAER